MARLTHCPHCGKELSNPEKLAWHLSRECPVMSQVAADDRAKDKQRTVSSASSSR